MQEENNSLMIALVSAASGILIALGAKEWVPSLFDWLKFKTTSRANREKIRKEEIRILNERINDLEKNLEREKQISLQTQTTLRAMLPLMREIMKDHPNYITLLDTMENNIFGNKTPADGECQT